MIYSPKDVEEMVGISTASLREQRARFPYSFGKQNKENGRWSHSGFDLIQMACIRVVEPYVSNQFQAARISYWVGRPIARLLGINTPDTFEIHPSDVIREVYPDAENGVLDLSVNYKYAIFGDGNPIITNNATRVADLDDPVGCVVRLDLLADTLPRKLIARLLADQMSD